VLDPAGITYVEIDLLFHDRNPRLLDQNPRTLTHPYTVRLGLDPTLEPRDYEGVPWGDEDEDMTSVWVDVEVVGRRSGDEGEVVPIPSLQRLFDRS
jgi:hypothetical protein